jgi:hypothetical protein
MGHGTCAESCLCREDFLPHLNISAIRWLTEIDEEARKRTEALQAEQMRFNKSTLRAAWIAAGAAIAGILVTVGLPYVQYRIAQPEIARHTAIRNGLQSLYEQGTGLLKEGIPLSNSVDSRGIWLT